jgi:hypothetical protein
MNVIWPMNVDPIESFASMTLLIRTPFDPDFDALFGAVWHILDQTMEHTQLVVVDTSVVSSNDGQLGLVNFGDLKRNPQLGSRVAMENIVSDFWHFC